MISYDKARKSSNDKGVGDIVHAELDSVLNNSVVTDSEQTISPLSVKAKASNTPETEKSKRNRKSENAFLRDFPRDVVGFAKSKFPTARNNTDAVCAYIYVRSGKSIDVPEHIKDLADTWSEDKSFEAMDKRIYNIEQTQKKIYDLADDLVLIATYLIFDRMGFRQDRPGSPERVNLLEPGVEELLESIKVQAKKLRQKKAIKDGRPKSQT